MYGSKVVLFSAVREKRIKSFQNRFRFLRKPACLDRRFRGRPGKHSYLLHHRKRPSRCHRGSGLLGAIGAGLGAGCALADRGHLHPMELLPDGSKGYRFGWRERHRPSGLRRSEDEHTSPHQFWRQTGQSIPGGSRSHARQSYVVDEFAVSGEKARILVARDRGSEIARDHDGSASS